MPLLIVGSLVLIAGIFAVVRFNYWKKAGANLQKSGYVPPTTPLLGRLAFRFITRLARFVMIGPVKVIGRKHSNYKGRLIVAANHQFQMDFAMVASAVPNFHYMTAIEELQGARGLVGAWTGAFGVDRKAPGEAVIQASTTILKRQRRSRVLIFPQGKLVYDNVIRPEDFKTGAVRILKHVASETPGEPAAILPMGVFYKRDPKHMTWGHKLARKLNLRWFRRAFGVTNYGGTVVVGEPIPVASLPEDPKAATDLIRVRIQELLDTASKN